MGAERPRELTGQMSINELLIAMGEAPVENFVLAEAPDDASWLLGWPPAPPGL